MAADRPTQQSQAAYDVLPFPRVMSPMAGVSASAGPVIERDGFRWISTAVPGTAPAAPAETRILYRSPCDRNLAFYQAISERAEFDQPAVDMHESFFVVEGQITRTVKGEGAFHWRSGDAGYIDHGEDARLAYEAGTRVVRILWSASSISPAIGQSPTQGALPGAAPSKVDRTPPYGVHAYGDLRRWAHEYQGAQVCTVAVHQDADRRRATIYTLDSGRQGAEFPEVPADMIEIIYVTQGMMEISPEDCEPLRWGAGDLIFWPYDRYQRHRYSAGLGSFCYFLSGEMLPDFRSHGAD